MGKMRPEVLQGTLDLMVLKTIEVMEPLPASDSARFMLTIYMSRLTVHVEGQQVKADG
jgi:hypothetical protein